MQLALPAGLIPLSAGQMVAPPPPAPPIAQPVVERGPAWVERFMVAVALVALVFLATVPRGGRNAPPTRREEAALPPGGAAAVTPAAAREAPPEAPKKDFFTIGSTEDDVMTAMGPPREIYDNRWWYGSSYVDFNNGRVVNFYNSIHGELKVKMRGSSRSRPTALRKGLTKDEVLNLQGTPTRLAGNRWYYGSSYVDFRDDRVADFFNGVLRELKVSGQAVTP